MQVNPYGPQPPTQGPQRQGYPQPVVYRPGVPGYAPGYGAPDTYRPGMPPTGPVGGPGMGPPQKEYEYIAPKDVAFGIAGAAAGFFIGGPIGALIGGAIGLVLSAIIRAIAHFKESKQQQPVQGAPQMPAPPNYPGQPRQGQPQYQNQYNYQMDPNQQRYQQPYQQYPPR